MFVGVAAGGHSADAAAREHMYEDQNGLLSTLDAFGGTRNLWNPSTLGLPKTVRAECTAEAI
jgi:hypothetical protein